MGKKDLSKISSPISTGGAGFQFETKVQAFFTLTMLVNGEIVCLKDSEISKIIYQARRNNIYTDDVVLYAKDRITSENKALYVQAKRSIALTKSDKEFKNVINSAWNDYKDNHFDKQNDKIALVTGTLSKTDIKETRALFDIARTSNTSTDFFTKVNQQNLFTQTQRNKLNDIREILKWANDNEIPNDDEVFGFFRVFYILSFDLGVTDSIDEALIRTVCSSNFSDRILSTDVWNRICEFCQNENKNAGEVTKDSSIPEYLELKKILKNVQFIPEEYDENLEIPNYQNLVGLTKFSLISAWREDNEKDRNIVSKFLKYFSYDETVNEVLKLQTVDSKRIIKDNRIWRFEKDSVISQQITYTLTEAILNDFTNVVGEIFSEISPEYNLPLKERAFATVFYKEPLYSKELKKNIVESLIWLYLYKDKFRNIESEIVQNYLDSLVICILKNKGWKMWATLNEYLPIFAELSPDCFLNLLQETLVYKPESILELFKNEGDGVFGGCLMTGILWALEILAFYKEYFPRVVDLLVILCSLDTGGNYTNRPYNSLREIFLPWITYIQSDENEKINAIKRVMENNTDLGAKLIIDILGSYNSVSTPIAKPKFHQKDTNNFDNTISKSVFNFLVENYAEILMTETEKGKILLSDIIKKFDGFYGVAKNIVIKYIDGNGLLEKLNDKEKYDVWYSLNLLILKHKRFPDAKWVLQDDKIKMLEKFAKKCESVDLLQKYKILFSEYETELLEDINRDWDIARNKLNQQKDSALREIIDFYGIEILKTYIENDKMANNIGFTLSRIITDEELHEILPYYLESQNLFHNVFIKYFLWCSDNDENFVKRITFSTWSENQKLRLFLYLRFEERTWILVEKNLKNVNSYWKQVEELPLRSSSDLNIAIKYFVKCKRYDFVILSCFAQLYNKENINDEILAEALLKNNEKVDYYDLSQLISYIQNQSISEEIKMQIEFKYLSLFDDDTELQPKTLISNLCNNPDFFNDMLNVVYKSENDINTDKEISEKQKLIAKNGYKLLHLWKNIPGIKNNAIDEVEFKNWVQQACQKAKENGRLQIAQIIIGQVLYYAPSDSNGLWINKAVAEVLNEPNNMKMLDGFYTESINSRGVYTVDTTGKSDLVLSNIWKEKADKLKEYGFHNFAVIVQKISANYLADSERNKKLDMPGSFTYVMNKNEDDDK